MAAKKKDKGGAVKSAAKVKAKKVAAPEKERNLEEVETTLEEIREEERQKSKSRSGVRRFFAALAFPFVALFRKIRRGIGKLRMPITVKTTVIYTLLFTLALTLIVVFVIKSVSGHLAGTAAADDGYITRLIVTSVALVVISVVVVAALGSLASRSMLSPIRRMVKRIDSISGDDLTTRLDDVDSQDELKELTERINEMLDKLETSFDRQKRFVSDASHELKTPIAVIRGYAELLRRWGKNDEAVLTESLESISREADNMKRIVEQLLLLARVGQYMVTKEEVALREELNSVVDAYRLVHKTRPFVLEADKEVVAYTDRSLITECVRALVDNAVKYSAEDSPVEVELTAEEGTARIAVRDHGEGISKDDLPRVFDRFYRCDRARNRDANSIGLGLTIVKSLMELLGGTVDAESEKGKGSVFRLSFPLKEGKGNE